jgi:hypothetical protein
MVACAIDRIPEPRDLGFSLDPAGMRLAQDLTWWR